MDGWSIADFVVAAALVLIDIGTLAVLALVVKETKYRIDEVEESLSESLNVVSKRSEAEKDLIWSKIVHHELAIIKLRLALLSDEVAEDVNGEDEKDGQDGQGLPNN